MREFKKRRSKKEEFMRLVLRALGVLVLFVVTIMLLRAAWGMYTKMAAASQAQDEAEAALARAVAQQQGVSGSLSELSTERGEETQIRERFGVVRPGEGEIDIVRDQSASTTSKGKGESWWLRIWHTLWVW